MYTYSALLLYVIVMACFDIASSVFLVLRLATAGSCSNPSCCANFECNLSFSWSNAVMIDCFLSSLWGEWTSEENEWQKSVKLEDECGEAPNWEKRKWQNWIFSFAIRMNIELLSFMTHKKQLFNFLKKIFFSNVYYVWQVGHESLYSHVYNICIG